MMGVGWLVAQALLACTSVVFVKGQLDHVQPMPIADAPTFSCDNWDDYTVAEFAAFAQSPDTIGEDGRKCTITSGSSGTACNYYVKYDVDGTGYTGLTFQGTPGGSGCCSSISDCSTLNGAASWLKSQHKELCCDAPTFSCDNWDDYTVAEFAAFAQSPDTIGEDGRKCTITSGSSGTACNYYVKYDVDGTGYTGLTFQGTPGGSGCCSSISDCSTLNGAASWLKSQHKELCCDAPTFSCDNWDDYTVAEFAAFAQSPDTIGEDGRKCTITSGSSGTACNYYVKYDVDGTGYTGLTFQGTPGGSGCCSSISDCSTLNGAASWLKSQHKELCCDAPTFSCDNWDDYTVAEFAAFAQSPDTIGEDGRKCTITSGSSGTACNYYVKYDVDGTGYTGLTFQGTPGGSGCCSSISDCSTLNGAASWLKSQHKELCCDAPTFSCDNWDDYTVAEFAAFAQSPDTIGEDGRKCTITSGSSGTACNYYVKYDVDGTGYTGLTFQGTPGGSGCCSSISDCSTLNGAASWLKSQHKELCCDAPTFSCDNWDDYTVAEFAAFAQSPDTIGEDGRKCTITSGSSGTACNYYVKYDVDGTGYTGLTFQGTPGGSGCCSSISDCSTLNGAASWLKSQHKELCCDAPTFSCDNWDDYTVAEFAAFAQSPDTIGEDGRKCTITSGSSGTACNYYVKYDVDGTGYTGLTFQGTPGGSGCCSSISDCSTLNGAASWLKSQHKELCCDAPTFSCDNWDDYTVAEFAAFAQSPDTIGEDGRKCTITSGSSGTACNYYVKYDVDGTGYTGLTFQGTPGGSGCCSSISDCSTLNGAASWLKSQHKELCCDAPTFSCDNWDDYTVAEFAAFAQSPDTIGEDGRKCTISSGSSGTACNYYVKYDVDGTGYTGLSFQGTPGGSGCCSSVSDCSTLTGAATWLKSQHKELCCDLSQMTDTPPTGSTATSLTSTVGHRIAAGLMAVVVAIIKAVD